MGKLFKIEMKKLCKSTAMRIMLLVIVVLSVINIATYVFIDKFAEGDMAEMMRVDGYGILQSLLMDNSDSMLFAVLLIAILIGGDFSARTLQTQIAAGYSRAKVIMSRFFSTIVAFLVFYIVTMLLAVGGVSLFLGFGEAVTGKFLGETALQIFMSVFMGVATLTIYLFFCFLVKSTGAGIGICLPFMLIGVSILQMISMAFPTCEKIISFTPFGQAMMATESLDGTGYFKFFGVGIVWIMGMLLLTHVTFKKAELK